MNETNAIEAAADTAAENEQKEARREEGGLEPAGAAVLAPTDGEKTTETVRAEDGAGRAEIGEVLRAVEQALPEFLRQNRERATRREHPAGEVFFRGSAEEVTDAEAEEVARKQLERSGLLRGQRVRVAD